MNYQHLIAEAFDHDQYVLRIRYRSQRGVDSSRSISPIRWINEGLLLALCLGREEPRTFTLSGILHAELADANDVLLPEPVTMNERRTHPAATIMPLMDTDRFAEFKESIKTNGQRMPILLWDDEVIDGRHRYRACQELGIEPCFDEVDQMMNPDPIDFVLDLNQERRDLKPGQREMIAARVANLRSGQKEKKQVDQEKVTGKTRSTPQNTVKPALPIGRAQNETPEEDPKPEPKSTKSAAKSLGVTERQVGRAQSVIHNGCDDLCAMVEAGQINTSAAEKFAKAFPNKKKQAKIVANGPDAIREAMRDKSEEDPKKYARATMVGVDKAIREAATHNTKHRPKDYARFERAIEAAREVTNGWIKS